MRINGRHRTLVKVVATVVVLLTATWCLFHSEGLWMGDACRDSARVGGEGAGIIDRTDDLEQPSVERSPIKPVPYPVDDQGSNGRTSDVTIQFVDSENRPVAGAEAVLTEIMCARSIVMGSSLGPLGGVSPFDLPAAMPFPDRVLAAGVTNAEGFWTVPVPPGAWVRARGTTSDLSGNSTIGLTPLNSPGAVRMCRIHSLVVRVVDREGRPVEGIHVGTNEGRILDGTRSTGVDGIARLTVLWGPEERVWAYAMVGVKEFESRPASQAQAANGLEVMVDRGVTVLARILGGDAASERVLVWPAAEGAVRIGNILSSNGLDPGSFRHFSGGVVAVAGFMPKSRVKFALFENGIRTAVAEITIPDAPHCEVILDAGGGFIEVSARMLDEAGQVRRDERMWARVIAAGGGDSAGSDIVVITDEAGRVHTRLPKGTLRVASFREGLVNASVLDLTNDASDAIDLGDVVVPGLALIAQGRLRDATGAPCGDCDVEVWPVEAEYEDARPWIAWADENGAFEIRGWNHGGLFDLVATDGEQSVVVEGLPAGTTDLELVVRPLGTLVGKVITGLVAGRIDLIVQAVPSPAMEEERARRIDRTCTEHPEFSGAFELRGLFPGLYDVNICMAGKCVRRIESVRIPEEGGIISDPRLQEISIAAEFKEVVVRVLGPGGPLEANVMVRDEEDTPGPPLHTRSSVGDGHSMPTDALGEARFVVPTSGRVPVHVLYNGAWRSFTDPAFPLEVLWIEGATVEVGAELGAELPALPGVGGLEIALLNLEAAGVDAVPIGNPATLPDYGVPTVAIPAKECSGEISVRFDDIPRDIRFGVLIAPTGAIDRGCRQPVKSRGSWYWIGEVRIPKNASTHSIRLPVSADLIARMIPQ